REQRVRREEGVGSFLRLMSHNRAMAEPPHEYATGASRDLASLDRAMDGERRVFDVAADYRLWARRPKEIYESNVTGTKNVLGAAKRAGVEQFIYTSTVATVAVDRPQLPNEATESQLGEMVGH